jgi:putative ABC transport system permease protein
METLLQDLRYGIRSLFRQPSFAITAILTLMLGIGATTAIFSVVNGVVLRPLPFERADRIVAITKFWSKTGIRSVTVSGPDFHDFQAQSRSFQAMAYWAGWEISVTSNGAADYATVLNVTPGFFEVLGARAVRGRLLSEDEQKPGGPFAVVITDAYWRQQFNGDARAVGSTVRFNDSTFTIVGVLPPGIRYPARADIYFPAWIVPETTSRSAHNYRVIARLRDGVSLEQARAEMTAIAKRLAKQYPQSNEGKLAAVVPLHEFVVGTMSRMLFMLFGAGALVLLIACANVANLQLARSSVRAREMVVRSAVGASRRRLIRQLLTESSVLALAAGLCGAWLARLGVFVFVKLAPEDLPRINEVHVDATALLFALGIAGVASVLFGLAPALQVSRMDLAHRLREGGKGAATGGGTGWARAAFVVSEVALAVVLVAGAGMFARSLAALAAVNLGFDVEQLLVLRTTVPVNSDADAPRATAFYREVLSGVRTLPGVAAAGAVTSLPTLVRSDGGYVVEGASTLPALGARSPQALLIVVTPDYFKTLRVPLRRGRDFSDMDRMGAPFVAIINESLARAAFPDRDPIGHRIQCGLDRSDFMTIVGVVADVRTGGPASSAQAELYMPYEQHPGPATALNLVVRTGVADPSALAQTIRRKIAGLNPDVPVKATTMEETISTASATSRFRTVLLVIFASIALLLALAGVYGVMAYVVGQRVPELGVRVALGATPENIMALVLAQGARLAATGLAIGLVLASLSGRVLEGMLFGVTARDPVILAAVAIVVAFATFVACYIPGRRAVRVDPISALRGQ